MPSVCVPSACVPSACVPSTCVPFAFSQKSIHPLFLSASDSIHPGSIDTPSPSWLRELAHDVSQRLDDEAKENGRVARSLVASCRFENDGGSKWAVARSRRALLRSSATEALARDGLALLLYLAEGRPPRRLGVTLLGLTAEGFEPIGTEPQRGSLKRMFAARGTGRADGVEAQLCGAARSGGVPIEDGGLAAGAGAREPEVAAPDVSRVAAVNDARATGSDAEAAAPASAESVANAAKGDEAQWACAACTFLNSALLPTCELCGTPSDTPSTSIDSLEVVQGRRLDQTAQVGPHCGALQKLSSPKSLHAPKNRPAGNQVAARGRAGKRKSVAQSTTSLREPQEPAQGGLARFFTKPKTSA